MTAPSRRFLVARRRSTGCVLLAMRAFLAVLLVLLPPRSASADEWYGWQTLGSDLAAHLLFGAGLSRENHYVTATGVALWILGPPAIHLANDEPGRAGVSLAGRFLIPALGAGIGATLAGDG